MGDFMERILCIVSAMNTGGAETFLMKLYRNIDRTKIQFDFCVNTKNNFYEDEINQLGGNIYVVEQKTKNLFKSFHQTKDLVKRNKYNTVIRVNQHSLSTIDLLAAKAGGATNLVMRSSNAASGSISKEVLHKVFSFLPKFIPTVKLAPSKLAAEYTFGKKAVKNEKVIILQNGLPIEQFRYRDDIRSRLRKEFNVEDKLVILHVGRFSKQKNHRFLLEVFNEVLKKNKDAILLSVGNGELEDDIKQQAIKLGIIDKIIFTGRRSDVNEIYNMADIFLFPSLFEGMPNTVIEAQTSGLPCLISDSITSEVEVTDIVKSISLEESERSWADELLKLYECNSDNNRLNYSVIMEENGYDVKDVVDMFSKIIAD